MTEFTEHTHMYDLFPVFRVNVTKQNKTKIVSFDPLSHIQKNLRMFKAEQLQKSLAKYPSY